MKRSTPMKRTPFKVSVRPSFSSVKPEVKPKRMKSSKPKMTPIRKSARGQECLLRFPGICNHDNDTVVWCHSNSHKDGKGGGLKARDEEGCYGCYACHAWLDGGYAGKMTRARVDQYFDVARMLSQQILKTKGLLA